MRQTRPGNGRPHASAGRSRTRMAEHPLLNSGFVIKDLPRKLTEPAEPDIPERAACHFDIYRADQVRLTATQFSGGDWRWQLSDKAGQILVEAGGYPSEDKCREAVTILQRHGAHATFVAKTP